MTGIYEALSHLRDYVASVWFDEASATDEERELMHRATVALASTTSSARKHYEYTLARFDEADRDDRGWRRVAMERAKEELDRLTVEPPPNPSEELVRLQLLASVMLEALKTIRDKKFEGRYWEGRRMAFIDAKIKEAIALAEQHGVKP